MTDIRPDMTGDVPRCSEEGICRHESAMREPGDVCLPAALAESWNAAHPVGTAVRYWPVYPPMEGIPPVDTTTRTPAWTLGDGAVVVSIVGRTGGVHLSHIELIK